MFFVHVLFVIMIKSYLENVWSPYILLHYNVLPQDGQVSKFVSERTD